MKKNYQSGSHTDVGMIRQVNEDFLGSFESPNGDIFVVCDGMGGHIGGATASKLAVESIRNFFLHPVYSPVEEALSQALAYAHKQIIRYAVQDPELEGMGTTCVVVLLKDNLAHFAHLGDSRLYLFRNNTLSQLTKDHSKVQNLIDSGLLTHNEAFQHPSRHILTKALGQGEPVADVSENPLKLSDGDILLLCTDGLTNMVTDAEIRQILAEKISVDEKTVKLTQKANQAGGKDNISVLIIEQEITETPVVKSIFEEIPEIVVPEKPVQNIVPVVETITNPPVIEKPVPSDIPVNKIPEKTMSVPKPVSEIPENKNNPTKPVATKKSPDWALIILIGLFIAVLAMFFTNWGSITNDPKPSELYTAPVDTTTTNENTDIQEVDQEPQQAPVQKPDNQPKPEVTSKKDTIISYAVKEGDNITKIADRFNLKKATLKKLNNMEEDEIKVAQKLKIKVRTIHKVGPGDILSKLSEKYGVSRDLIKKANEMTENRTTRGEKLIIPLARTQ